jgi:molybdopterin/thiamine biosynthesis adenylyltransferase
VIERGRIVLVGLGGIGSFLVRLLLRFVAPLRGVEVRVVLADGDSFEERNRERMEVPELGNKAVVLCRSLSRQFARPGLYIRPVDRYVTAENAAEIIVERDVVFACVDRHASRKVLSDRSAELRDVVLISGGNDGLDDPSGGTYGNVQVFRRVEGRELNPPLTRYHPEIQEPADEVPAPSCVDLAAAGAGQIVIANHVAAGVMAMAFYRLLRAGPESPLYDEACFDIVEARVAPQEFGRRS